MEMFSKKDIKKLILPLIVEQFLLVAVGIADTMMISSVGEAAVSGVSLVDNINILIINLFTALATGGAVVAGHALGERDPGKASESADQLFLFVAAASAAVMLLILAGHTWILTHVFGSIEADVMSDAEVYMLITAFSIPFIAIYNAGAAIFRSMGDSKTSMKVSLLMNGLNIAGNALLIYGFGMGVEGAAIPTLVSRVIAAVIIYSLLRNQDRIIHVGRRPALHFHKNTISRICYIGIPNGIENSFFQLGKIMVLSLVSSFGTVAITANAVASNISTFEVLPGMAMGNAIVTVVSQCTGAGRYDEARRYTKLIMKYIYFSMWCVNIFTFLCIPLILKAYHLSDATAVVARQIMTYYAVCVMIHWPLSFSIPNALRAAGDVKFTMVVSLVSMWVFRVGFSYILGRYLGWGVFGVWVAMTIDWVFRAVLFMWRYLSGRWEKIKF